LAVVIGVTAGAAVHFFYDSCEPFSLVVPLLILSAVAVGGRLALRNIERRKH